MVWQPCSIPPAGSSLGFLAAASSSAASLSHNGIGDSLIVRKPVVI